jgi:hypothetical protein
MEAMRQVPVLLGGRSGDLAAGAVICQTNFIATRLNEQKIASTSPRPGGYRFNIICHYRRLLKKPTPVKDAEALGNCL